MPAGRTEQAAVRGGPPGATQEQQPLDCDVLVIGAGAAGIAAAIAAADAGASVALCDKSQVGRGGATVMAMMTVAAALGHEEPDDWELHYRDTVAGGRGICNEELVELLCREAPERILASRDMGVHWAAHPDGRLKQVQAPGHSRRRCVYVDVLATGTGVSKGLRMGLNKRQSVRHLESSVVVELVRAGGRVAGAVCLDLERGRSFAVRAGATVLATGGLTEAYARNSASVNMTGDGFGLALRAGAELCDMEFVQFFPIGHLWPRLIGLDPIMWDPFRYKLGGRLCNGAFEPFVDRDVAKYVTTRDVLTKAILDEVAAGRGSPHGGVWLDFLELPYEQVRAAFPPICDKLRAQGVDLAAARVEVAPMAHYTIGGVRVDGSMRTSLSGLYAAGEATAGLNGANRLSGNAISEALVFGHEAGRHAAREALATGERSWDPGAAAAAAAKAGRVRGRTGDGPTPGEFRRRVQRLMWDGVGPFRNGPGLESALAELGRLRDEVLPRVGVPADLEYNLAWAEAIEAEGMLDACEAVARSALERRESRGAHQREDHPESDDAFRRNSVVRRVGGSIEVDWAPVVRLAARD